MSLSNQPRKLACRYNFFWREWALFMETASLFRIFTDMPNVAVGSVATCQLLKCNFKNWLKKVIIESACHCETGFGTTAAVGMSVKGFHLVLSSILKPIKYNEKGK
jgi:hypothetical protein